MGSSQSTEKNTTPLSLPFDKSYSPSFYFEKNLAHLFYSVKSNRIKGYKVSKLDDIASIIIGRPDQFNQEEISSLLETIIEYYAIDTPGNLNEEQALFRNAISIIDNLNTKFNILSNYRKRGYTKYSYTDQKVISVLEQKINYSSIIDNISPLINGNFDKKLRDIANQTSSEIKSAIPARITNTPTPNDFLPPNVDSHIFEFNDKVISTRFVKNLGCRGLTTNGQYIFLLSSLHLLFVFPIMNNGILMPPKLIRLPYTDRDQISSEKVEKSKIDIQKEEAFELSPKTSITSFSNYIEIHSFPLQPKSIKISMNKIIPNDDFQSPILSKEANKTRKFKLYYEMMLGYQDLDLEDSSPFLTKVTNGVIYVVVQKHRDKEDKTKISFECEIHDAKTDRLIKTVQLCANHRPENNELNKNIRDLFPDIDYSEIPIETNGSTISFIFTPFFVYRTFSLITGEFLKDEGIMLSDELTKHIIASTIDSINNCRWLLTSSDDNKVCLQKMHYNSNIDPFIFHIEDIHYNNKHTDILVSFNHLLRHYVCSLNPPSFILCNSNDDFNTLLNLLTTAVDKKDQLSIQSLCMLVSLNMMNKMKYFGNKLVDFIFDFIKTSNIETGLKFLLFFPNFQKFIQNKERQKETTAILFQLFEDNNTNNNNLYSNDSMFSYALKIIENCDEFGTLPLLRLDDQYAHLLQHDQIQCLYIIHQRVIVRNAQNMIDDEKKIEDQKEKKATPISILIMYLNNIQTQFQSGLTKCKNANNEFDNNLLIKFADAPIYKLFHNFIRLITPLTNKHEIASIADNIFKMILKDYIRVPILNGRIRMNLLETCYVYGLILSTLISGGGVTPFEEKFRWVIPSNTDLINDKNKLNEIGGQPSEEEKFSLDILYSKIRPNMNKDLSEDIRKLDKCVIHAITLHMNCYDELVRVCDSNSSSEEKFEISKLLRCSYYQMQLLRFSYQKNRTEELFNHLLSKAQLLCQIKSSSLTDDNPNSKSKVLREFIDSTYSTRYIKEVFLLQKSRISAAQNGFPLLNDVFKKDKNQYLKEIIGHVLKKFLTSFSELNSILQIKGDKSDLNSNDIDLFFKGVYPLTSDLKEEAPEARIIPYRFFKSINIFPNIFENLLCDLLKSFKIHSNDSGFYALTVSLIQFSEKLPADKFQDFITSFIEIPTNSFKLSLIENMINKAKDGFVYSDEFVDTIFGNSLLTSPINVKIVNRIRYQLVMIRQDEKLDNYLNEYLLFIGQHLFNIDNYHSLLVSEYIALLRKVILHAIQNETSPIRKGTFYEKLMNSSANNDDESKEAILLGLCAICGYQMETVNPYSIVNVTLDSNAMNTYIIIQGENILKESDDQFNLTLCKCYEIPFTTSNKPIKYSSFPKNSLITVDPEVTNNNDIFSDKIKKLIMEAQNLTNMTFPVCAQALLNFYTNDSKIITSEEQNIIDYLCTMITPFNDVYNTNNQIKTFKSLKIEDNETNKFKILPELTPQFGVIEDHLSTTYLSLPLNNDSSEFEVNLEITDDDKILSNSNVDLFHFGVASDTINEEEIRISTIGFPSGISFPEKKKVCDINFSESTYKISFIVNPTTRKISLQSNEIDFPIGRKFKLIIFKKKSTKLTFNPIVKEEVFNANGTPDLDKLFSLKRKSTKQEDYEDYNYLRFPDFVEKEQTLKPDYRQYEGVDKFTHEMDLNQKLRLMTVHHPMDPVLHLSNSQAASKSIIDHHLKGLFNKLGRQWLTVLLLKITSNDPSLISKHAFELFSLFSVPIETFNQDEFNQGHFPFSLEKPPWESTTVPTSLPKEEKSKPSFDTLVTDDMMNALSVMIKNSDCMDQIAEGLLRMSTSNNLHQIALPQKYHSFVYIKEGSDSNAINLSSQSIVALNDYEGLQKNVAYMINDEDEEKKNNYDLPHAFKSDSQISQLYVNNDTSREISILEVNSSNSSFKNDWIVDTPIELLVHLKNFSFAAKKDNHLSIAKTILLNLYLGKSPFTIPYIHQFQNFAQMKLQTTLFYKDELYIKSLIALGNYLKSMENPDDYYVNLYESEQPMISNNATIEEAAHFPEFFPPNTKFPEVTTDTVTITNAIVNPISIKSGFQSRILAIKKCFEEHKSLVGVPFWDILPYWNRIVEIFGFDNQKVNNSELKDEEYNEIFPLEIVQLNNNICQVSNLTDDEFNARLIFNKKLSDAEAKKAVLEYSDNYSFNGSRKFGWLSFDKPIKIGKGNHFFSITVPSDIKPWESLCSLKLEPINKQQQPLKDRPETKIIKVTDDYKKEFIRSMKAFYFDWKPSNTENLLNIFNLDDLRSPSFKTVANVVLNSDLYKMFPKTVVLLRALLLYHFNYIRFSQNKNQVSEFLWNSCTNLIPILRKSAELSRSIAVAENETCQLIIDQRAAVLLINDYNNITTELNSNKSLELSPVEKRTNSIISQWAKFVKSANMNNLKGKHSLKIRLSNTLTLEATNAHYGTMTYGLLKNFLNDASDSIFQPSTQLFMKTNCPEEYFIPEIRKRRGVVNEEVFLNEYYSIGVLIGIISRESFPQYLPFAPFIWKFIAGEEITPDDIAEVDIDLRNHFRAIRNKQVPPTWNSVSTSSWLPSSLSSPVKKIGRTISSSSYKEDEDEEINRYLVKVAKDRLKPIEQQLIKIREGFFDNTELKASSLLSGKVLSFLAQGTGDLTVNMLKEITKVYNLGPAFNKVINFFWQAVEEFNNEQIRMLLKFITGVTRIPKISEHGNNFYINILKMNCKNPDIQLPTAQACFNKLSLPMYSSKEIAKERILFAIQNCLTLEAA